MPYGYNGKILRVDLSSRTISVEEPDENFYRRYFGGWAFIAYYLLKELPPRTDPWSAENLLIFAPGVLTGAPVAGCGRHAVGAKSPATGAFGEGEAGGFWGAELKRAGFDAIVIKGQSEAPVYLWIHDGQAKFRDASHLWGRGATEVEAAICQELGDDRISVTQVGPAGERLVSYACVINERSRAAGRSGLGTVMGAKRLKAIAVRGTNTLPLANPERAAAVNRWMAANFRSHPRSGSLAQFGTAGITVGLNASGGLPVRNFNESFFQEVRRISGETLNASLLTGRDNCTACMVRCKPVVEVKGRYSTGPAAGGPEYETIAALGSNCGIADLEAITYAGHLCDEYGLDTIGTGVALSFAMECFENELISTADTDGVELRFGNAEAMVEMVGKIARREGLGDLLAKGLRAAAQEIGGQAQEFAMEIKDQPIPMHEPRLKQGLGVGYAVSPTGADHCHNIHDTLYEGHTWSWEVMHALGLLDTVPTEELSPRKMRLLFYETNLRLYQNCALLCFFLPYTWPQFVDIASGITGWETSAWELLKVGQRAFAMARAFNFREGFAAKDDYLPARFFKPLPGGPLEGIGVKEDEFEGAMAAYYEMMGWDPKTGAPTPASLAELDIEWVAEAMRRK